MAASLALVNVDVSADYGQRAATFVASVIRHTVNKKGEARIVFATGASQFEFFKHLVTIKDIPWENVIGFHLDEYCELSDEHPASFRRYLRERFVEKLPSPMKKFNYLDPKKVGKYVTLLEEAPIDLYAMGIGENGHLAFNDPFPICRFQDPVAVKRVALDEKCRKQQVGEGWFRDIEDAPKEAVTITIPPIMKGDIISIVCPDARKAVAVRDTLTGPISEACPASILRHHTRCIFFLDKHSASKLPESFPMEDTQRAASKLRTSFVHT